MDTALLTHYLHTQIPLSQSMGMQVKTGNIEEVVLSFPLGLNLNHQKTGFGGSLQAAATLAAWSRFHLILKESFARHEIVIAESHMRYLAPVTEDFFARCTRDHIQSSDLERFFKILNRRKQALLSIQAEIWSTEVLCATFSGVFMALSPKMAC
ncbi:MAG: YiiD C-terminal domain-containing protein [Alphaproteobacteria bacterium]|nr:YiiD C-terminal domain-containing protein [Alphaproteobacteria bacterium]